MRPATRLARAIVLRYPPVWRARYADEMLALIDDQPLRWRDVADLARRCLIERARALVEPADRPRLAAFLAGTAHVLLYVFVGAAFTGIGVATGWALKQMSAPMSEDVGLVGYLLITIAGCRAMVSFWPRRISKKPVPFPRVAIWMSVLFVGIVLQNWSTGLTGMAAWPIDMGRVYAFAEFTDWLWPANPLQDAFRTLGGVRESMKWARMELTRCETLAASGRHVPELANARAEMDRLLAAERDAMAILRGAGYRATIQGV